MLRVCAVQKTVFMKKILQEATGHTDDDTYSGLRNRLLNCARSQYLRLIAHVNRSQKKTFHSSRRRRKKMPRARSNGVHLARVTDVLSADLRQRQVTKRPAVLADLPTIGKSAGSDVWSFKRSIKAAYEEAWPPGLVVTLASWIHVG